MSLLGPRPSRCLITGASGFIGSRLCEHFDSQRLQPYVPLVRRPQAAAPFQARGVQAALGDLHDAAHLRRALQGCDAVVHLAHGDRGPAATRQLVDCAAAAGARRFVHVSSMSVHGPVPGPEAAREETARIGRYAHDYSDSKAEQEEIVQAAHDRGDLQAVILRPTVVYGPHGHFVLQVIAQAQAGVVTTFDEGSGVCNAVYVDDVCAAIDAALVSTGAVGEAMFITADRSITWGEFITAFAAMVEPAPRRVNLSSTEATRFWAAQPPAPTPTLLSRVGLRLKRLTGWRPPVAPWPPLGRVQRETLLVSFANDKAKRLLDWSPQTDFPRGAELTRAWLRSTGTLA